MVTTLTRTIGAIVAVLLFVNQPVAGHNAIAQIADEVGARSQQVSLPAKTDSIQGDGRLTFSLASDSGPPETIANEFDSSTERMELEHVGSQCGDPLVSCGQTDPCGSVCSPSPARCNKDQHEFWVVSTRCLTWNCGQANLQAPGLRVTQLSSNGQTTASTMDDYLVTLDPTKRVVFYVHGNRTPSNQAVSGGLKFFRRVKPYLDSKPTRWVIFVWPSAQAGVLLKDAREKAARTDAESLYLAWLLRHHAQNPAAIAMVGYSFGARVVSGSLHAMAGGCLGKRTLPQPHVENAGISVGFVAPAFDADWMTPGNYHAYSTRNLRNMTLMYNHRDIALRNHWRLSRERSSEALGFSGPRCFGPRADGTPLPVFALNCTASVRARHAERFYYDRACTAGRHMARMINQSTAGPRYSLSLKNDVDTSEF